MNEQAQQSLDISRQRQVAADITRTTIEDNLTQQLDSAQREADLLEAKNTAAEERLEKLKDDLNNLPTSKNFPIYLQQ